MKRESESGRWSWEVEVVVLSDGIGVVKEYSKVNEKQEMSDEKIHALD
jgi:hypothetical protein